MMSSGPGFARDRTPRATTLASTPLGARHSLVKSASKALLLAGVLSLLYAGFASRRRPAAAPPQHGRRRDCQDRRPSHQC